MDIWGQCDPGTIRKAWGGFIVGRWELIDRLSYDEPDKKIRRRYYRGRNGGSNKCVRALLRDHSGSARQYHRVSGRAVAIWIAPQYRSVRQTIQSGIGKGRSAPCN